jgi:hypothetical protein
MGENRILGENQHRYGRLVVLTDDGKWYWSRILHLVAFVPTGKRVSTIELVVQQNNLSGVLRLIASTIEIREQKREIS